MTKDTILEWLLGPARQLHNSGDVWNGLCERLLAGGVSLSGAVFRNHAVHPIFSHAYFMWAPGKPWELWYAPHHSGELISDNELFGHRCKIGRSRAGSVSRRAFGKIPLLAIQDITGAKKTRKILCVEFPFSDGYRNTGRWISARDHGFNEEEEQLIRDISPTLCLLLELNNMRRRHGLVLSSYVGTEPAKLIINGQIKRGDVSEIKAAMLFFDIRGFTTLSDILPSKELVSILNRFLDAICQPVEEAGGEVLKFIGDAVLAVFPIRDNKEPDSDTCRKALECAQQAIHSAMSVDTGGADNRGVVAALHFGKVVFGNIGAADRLDFTIIGKDVNLLSRLEQKCKEYDQDILASEQFSALVPECMQEVAKAELRGIKNPVTLFAPC
ncbi:MAG: adenylate/guanylate cyclase domain-containing protein [Aquisalinus sp.]|nr:adenylate/guanylate cyclase domain-containing protein [Aquisalinus sp.]